ncbi:hypothetical protein [Ferruginibacter profundus]
MRPYFYSVLLLLFITTGFTRCSAPQAKSGDISAAETAGTSKHSYLSMKVNGVSWEADHDITGIFHPKGYNNAILISGNKGAKDKTEQTFNLNLYNANGTGRYDIIGGNKDNSEVQLANLSNEHYLYGNVLGFSFHARITKAGNNPTELEAGFEGVLTGNAGDTIKITDGKFYYHE